MACYTVVREVVMTEKDTLQIFLETLLSPVGSGVFLWGAVAFIIKAIPPLNQHEDAKFWLAFVTSLLIPPGALGLQIALGYATFTGEAMFTAIGVGYMTSQAVHRGTSAVRAKVAENDLDERKRALKERLVKEKEEVDRMREAYVGKIPQGHFPAESPTPSYVAPIAPAAPRLDPNHYDGDDGDVQPFPDGERGASGGR